MADYLEDMDMRQPIRTKSAPVDLNVLQPLDVRQRVAGHLTLERHIAAHHCGAVSRQAGLQDRPVEGGLCHNTKTSTHFSVDVRWDLRVTTFNTHTRRTTRAIRDQTSTKVEQSPKVSVSLKCLNPENKSLGFRFILL